MQVEFPTLSVLLQGAITDSWVASPRQCRTIWRVRLAMLGWVTMSHLL